MAIFRKLQDKLYHWLINEPPNKSILPYDFDRLKHEIKPGDVLLIEGRSRVSRAIRTISQSPWTHAALYIGRLYDFEDPQVKELLQKYTDAKEGERLIIESLLDRGNVLNSLTVYENHHIRICRPIGITPNDLELVIKYAIRALGKPYNMRHLLDLTRFVLPWTILPRRWGSSLFRTSTGEPESGICSSLVAEAFSSVQFPILPLVLPHEAQGMEVYQRNPYLFSPKDFDYSPYFEIIKYPLFNPDEPLPYYRRLPWSRTGFLHQDHGVIAAPPKKKKKLSLFRRNRPDPDEDEISEEDESTLHKD